MAAIGAQPGNQNALKGRLWESALKRALARKANGDMHHGLDTLADKVVAAAEAGEQWAIFEIGNRLDGKPAQAIAVSGDSENPVTFNHTVEFIGASAVTPEA